jgi:hypothetical protein
LTVFLRKFGREILIKVNTWKEEDVKNYINCLREIGVWLKLKVGFSKGQKNA